MSGYYGSETSVGGFAQHSIYDVNLGLATNAERLEAIKLTDEQAISYNRETCEAISLYAGIDTNDKICVIEDGPSPIAEDLARYCSLAQPIVAFFLAETQLNLEDFVFTISPNIYPRFDKIILRTCLYDSKQNRNILRHLNTLLDVASGKVVVLHRCSLSLSLPFPYNVTEKLLDQEYGSQKLLADALASDYNIEWDILKLVQMLSARVWLTLLHERRIQPVRSAPVTAGQLRCGIAQLTESSLKYTPVDSPDASMQLVDTMLIAVFTPITLSDSRTTGLRRFRMSYNRPRLIHHQQRHSSQNMYEFEVTPDIQRQVKNEMPHLWNKSLSLYNHIWKATKKKEQYKKEWWGTVASFDSLGLVDSAKLPKRRLNECYVKK